jgi:type III secretion protein J
MGLCLGGCQITIYSDLKEEEATSMLALLLEKGVSCAKLKTKTGWDLSVDNVDLPAAVRLLNREGYPRHDFKDVGDVFGEKGLISSPQEDRIRYIYALSQEMGETISQMDGVLTARVHLVLPENDPLSDTLKPSSASIFVKYLPTSAVRQNVTQIKQIVLNGAEGLTMDKVSVVTMPGTQVEAIAVPARSVMGIEFFNNSVLALSGVAGVVLLLGLAGGFGASLLLQKRKTRQPAPAPVPAPQETPAAQEAPAE